MNPIIDIRDNEKLCFAEKTKSIILQKSGGAMAPLAPPVSTSLIFYEVHSKRSNDVKYGLESLNFADLKIPVLVLSYMNSEIEILLEPLILRSYISLFCK